jgi:heptosyltransferase-2
MPAGVIDRGPVRYRPIGRIVVRVANWIGDAVMNTALIAAIRERFPDAHLAVMARKGPSIVLENHPHIDEIFVLDDRSGAGRSAASKWLKRGKFDAAFVTPNSWRAALPFYRAGISIRVGTTRNMRRVLFTHPIPFTAADLHEHEVLVTRRLITPWRNEDLLPKPVLTLGITDEERAWATEYIHRIGGGKPVACLNPGAAFGGAKRWPPDRYAAVGKALVEQHGMAVFVQAGPGEEEMAREVCKATDAPLHNAARELTLRHLMAVLEQCQLLVTNDSGPMHIAAALGTPTVAIFGSTDPVNTAPWSDCAVVVQHRVPCSPCHLRTCPIDHRCMTGVTVEMVMMEVKRIKDESGRMKAEG